MVTLEHMFKNRKPALPEKAEGGAGMSWADPKSGEVHEIWRYVEADHIINLGEVLITAAHEVASEMSMIVVKAGYDPEVLPNRFYYSIHYPTFGSDDDDQASAASSQYLNSLIISAFHVSRSIYRNSSMLLSKHVSKPGYDWSEMYFKSMQRKDDCFSLSDSLETVLSYAYLEKDYDEMFDEYKLDRDKFVKIYANLVRKNTNRRKYRL